MFQKLKHRKNYDKESKFHIGLWSCIDLSKVLQVEAPKDMENDNVNWVMCWANLSFLGIEDMKFIYLFIFDK